MNVISPIHLCARKLLTGNSSNAKFAMSNNTQNAMDANMITKVITSAIRVSFEMILRLLKSLGELLSEEEH